MYILTAYNGQILGPIARLLGVIMNAIYSFITNTMGIENGSIAISIVIFTIFIYLCLFPLTYKQQKFSVLTRKMQPEMKEIQKKYKNRKDQASMQAMQEETQALYDKYGTNPTGSCVQMAIQMPILFALYRVFYNVPAYLQGVKDIFNSVVADIQNVNGYEEVMTAITEDAKIRALVVDFSIEDSEKKAGYIVDVLYKLSEDGWNMVVDSFQKIAGSNSALFSDIDNVRDTLSRINYVGPINISDTPWHMVTTGFDNRQFGLMIAALLIPLLSYGSQVLNLRLMPTAQNTGDDQMAVQMRTMNMMMPLMSLFFTFITPAGLGVYWIAGALVRTVQQFFLNKHFEKIDLEEIIEKNKEKAEIKAEKRGIRRNQIANAAMTNTRRSLSEKAKVDTSDAEAIDRANAIRENAKPGTMGAKANLVKKFNEGLK